MSKKIIYTLCAISIGLNLGMIGMTVMNRAARPELPPPGPGPGPGPERGTPPDPERLIEDHVRNVTRHLDLDEAQAQAVREIMARHVPALIQLRIEAETANGDLSEAYAASAFDAERFRRLATEASLARAKVDSIAALILVEEAAVLTTEQRKMFAEVAPDIHSRPAGARPQGGPRQGGPPPEGRRPKDGPPPR